MQLINESKRNYIFEIPPVIQTELNKASGVKLAECDHIRFKDYVTVKQNQLLFPKTVPGKDDETWIFNSVDDCEKWIGEYEVEVQKMTNKGFVPMARTDMSFYGVKSTALKINTHDWEMMQRYFSGGDEFKESDFAIFESWLANNFLDRDRERFPKDVLNSFNKSIVGKSKITAHQWGPPGNGRFYKSRIEELTVDQTLEMIGHVTDKNFKKHLQRIKEIDGGIFWLVPTYYMLNVSENDKQAVREVRSGIVKDMSIGFGAPRKIYLAEDLEEYDIESSPFGDSPPPEGVKVLWKEFRNTKDKEAEAYEGSHVFLGSQLGAATWKNAGNGVQVTTQDMDKLFEEWFQKRIGDDYKLTTFGYNQDNLEKNIQPIKNEIVLSPDFIKKFDYEKFKEFLDTADPKSLIVNSDNENIDAKESEADDSNETENSIDEIDIEKYFQAYLLKKDFDLNWITKKDLTEFIQNHFSKYIDGWVNINDIEDENIKAICHELDLLICKECLRDSKYLEKYLDTESKVVWSVAHVNTFEDNCFAYVEDTGKEDNEGRRVPKTARHLPHHDKGNGASGTGGVVDLPHLRNALARVGQIRPVTDKIDRANLIELSRNHLVAHAKKLGVGDYGEENQRSLNDGGVDDLHRGDEMELNFKIEDIGVDIPIDAEKLEDSLTQAQEAVTKAFTDKTTAMTEETDKKLKESGDLLEAEKAAKEEAVQNFTSLTDENEKLQQELKAVKEVYGDEYSIENLKRYKTDATAYRKHLIDGIIKFKKLLKIILTDEVENEIKVISNDSIERLKQEYERYEKLVDEKYPGNGVLADNTNPDRNVIDKDNEQPQDTEYHEARRRRAAQIY